MFTQRYVKYSAFNCVITLGISKCVRDGVIRIPCTLIEWCVRRRMATHIDVSYSHSRRECAHHTWKFVFFLTVFLCRGTMARWICQLLPHHLWLNSQHNRNSIRTKITLNSFVFRSEIYFFSDIDAVVVVVAVVFSSRTFAPPIPNTCSCACETVWIM